MKQTAVYKSKNPHVVVDVDTNYNAFFAISLLKEFATFDYRIELVIEGGTTKSIKVFADPDPVLYLFKHRDVLQKLARK